MAIDITLAIIYGFLAALIGIGLFLIYRLKKYYVMDPNRIFNYIIFLIDVGVGIAFAIYAMIQQTFVDDFAVWGFLIVLLFSQILKFTNNWPKKGRPKYGFTLIMFIIGMVMFVLIAPVVIFIVY